MTDEELEEQLEAFAEHRAQLKPPSPMTPRAIEQLRKRALRFRAKGVDLYEAFDKAMTSNWLSIYEPKPEHKEMRPSSHAEYKGPNYGERTEPEKARANVAQLRSMVRR